MSTTRSTIDHLCINTIRTLAMDAVQQANSGHPGAAMALAPLAYRLYARTLRHNPANPAFANRDRLVLSAGHASMLLYASLHLGGFDVSLDDIKAFRQLGSRTPGHPEFGHTPGVETTTGPLGQGAANSVGMAVAQKLAGRALQSAGTRHRRLSGFRNARRRLHDGGDHRRGGITGRTSASGQPRLVLRQQSHHHRRRNRAGLFRRRGEAL
jgi:hypothetical protein